MVHHVARFVQGGVLRVIDMEAVAPLAAAALVLFLGVQVPPLLIVLADVLGHERWHMSLGALSVEVRMAATTKALLPPVAMDNSQDCPASVRSRRGCRADG